MQDTPTGPRPITITPGGIVATLVLAVVIAGCIRLGFWQLERREQRRALNESVAARLDAPPIDDVTALADTNGLGYRVVAAAGSYDNDRAIVLPGRSLRGMPGVHLLVPLLLNGRRDAVLVNRGWLPSADATTVDLTDLAVLEPVRVRGLALPFPGRSQSLVAPERAQQADEPFRRVWFAIDEHALRAQFPYPLMPLVLQELPAADAPRYPARLEPPPLDEGPHLGYALQWFSFALIGIIGWLALVLRGRSAPRVVVPLMATSFCLLPSTASAQLRPLDPVEWRVFDANAFLIATAGAGVLRDQSATLAGTEGRLTELGNYRVTVRLDRMAVELAGTALWRLSNERVVQPPASGVLPANGKPRQEPGFASAATIVHVTPRAWPLDFVVRFGARIPTTSDESGLDRDRTDFFATGAFRYDTGPFAFTAENGVGIHGTVLNTYPQSDVWAYSFGAEYQRGPVLGAAQLVGHRHGRGPIVRGNEDLRELRLSATLGRTRWLTLTYLRGLADSSPRDGLRIAAGLQLRPLRAR